MPANKKYLTVSPWQRALKITAALIGGYMVSTAFHQFLMLFLPKKEVYTTMSFSVYIMWAVLMIIAFLAKNGWKIWGWYLLVSAVLLSPFLYQLINKQ
ncbi:MAG: hypothetical protein KF746_03005 [Chitinophagaceae bacterium]|nr:hypothetical protein [Chitinophagaceae bacterium]